MLLRPAPDAVVAATAAWVDGVVIGHNLCPFAAPVRRAGGIGYEVSDAADGSELLADLEAALEAFVAGEAPGEGGDSAAQTVLLIAPHAFPDFLDFHFFGLEIEPLLARKGLVGEVQVPVFHPGYLFAGEDPEAFSHYTNRAPYPILHLLREDDISHAVDHHPDPEGIPARNVAHLLGLGADERAIIRALSIAARR